MGGGDSYFVDGCWRLAQILNQVQDDSAGCWLVPGCLNGGRPDAIYLDCFLFAGPGRGCGDDYFKRRVASGAELEAGAEGYVADGSGF